MAIKGYLRSCTLGSVESRRGTTYCLLYNIVGLISEGSEDRASESTENCRFRESLSFDDPSPGNPREYPHKHRIAGVGYTFAADSVGLSNFRVGLQKWMYFETESLMALQGHSRSLILVPNKCGYSISDQ